MFTKVITSISYNSYIKYEKDIKLEELLNYLNPKLFTNDKYIYISSQLYIYNNIEEYINNINNLIKFIDNKANVINLYKEYNYVKLTMFNFLTNNNRKMINFNLAITELKKCIFDFIISYKNIINSDNRSDIYNKRILTNYINHLTILVKYLIEYSLQ